MHPLLGTVAFPAAGEAFCCFSSLQAPYPSFPPKNEPGTREETGHHPHVPVRNKSERTDRRVSARGCNGADLIFRRAVRDVFQFQNRNIFCEDLSARVLSI